MSKKITIGPFKAAISNAAFRKLGKRAKRIAIAKDALQQLELKRYKPTHDSYVNPLYEAAFSSDNAQAYLTGTTGKCGVCAKGALICSTVRIINKRTMCQLSAQDPEIIKIFGKRMWFEVEHMFEGWKPCYHDAMLAGINTNDPKCMYKRKRTSLESIMQNIIDNRGRLRDQKGVLID